MSQITLKQSVEVSQMLDADDQAKGKSLSQGKSSILHPRLLEKQAPTLHELESTVLAMAEEAAQEVSFHQKKQSDKPVLSKPAQKNGQGQAKLVPSTRDTLNPPALIAAQTAAEKSLISDDKQTVLPDNSGVTPKTTPQSTLQDKKGVFSIFQTLSKIREQVETSSTVTMAFNSMLHLLRANTREKASEQLAHLSEELEALQGQLSQALEALPGGVEGLLAKMSQLKGELADIEEKLASLDPDSPDRAELEQQQVALKAQLGQAKDSLADIERIDSQLTAKLAEYDALQASVGQQTDASEPIAAKDKSALARLLAVMSSISELIEELAETRTETQSAFMKKQQDARIQQLEKEAEKAEKAEKKKSFFGLLKKILAPIIAVAAVAAAIVTGGAASILIAAAFLAIAALDSIGNIDVLGKAAEGLAKGLKAMGLSETAANIVANVVLAIAMIAATFLAGKVDGAFQAVKGVASATKAAMAAKVAAGVQAVGGSANAALDIGIAMKDIDIAKAMKNIKITEATLSLLQQILDVLSDMAQKAFEESTQMWNTLSSAIQTAGNAGKSITQAMRTSGRI